MSETTPQQDCEKLMQVVGQVAGRRLLLCLQAAAEDTRKEREAAVLAERERCAKIAETCWSEFSPTPEQAVLNDRRDIAAAIRHEDKSR